MNLNGKITIAIRRFFKKYGRIILIALVIWLIIFLINQYLKRLPKKNSMINTYNPDSPIIDDGGSVPTRYRKNINQTVEEYFNYCNSKNYEQAYNILTDQCKEYLYDNELSLFQEYVDSIFTQNKIYNLQNYSNIDGIYVYDLIILDDIESTGTTEGYEPYKEKIALRKEGNEFKISNQGYIESKTYNKFAEDENLKVTIKSKDVSYRREGYNVTITNKTDKYLVLVDNTLNNEITLNLGDQKRGTVNYSNASLVLNPGETRNEVFIFDKFYDDQKDPTEICIEDVRILDEYEETNEDTAGIASRMYSYTIKLR